MRLDAHDVLASGWFVYDCAKGVVRKDVVWVDDQTHEAGVIVRHLERRGVIRVIVKSVPLVVFKFSVKIVYINVKDEAALKAADRFVLFLSLGVKL